MTILIVDDEESTREVLRDLLNSLGFKTILEASNGKEALKVLAQKKNQVHAIISDWEMPVMDGFSFLKKVSEEPNWNLILFLLISSEDFPEKHGRLDHTLQKPFAATTLKDGLNKAYIHRCKTRKVVGYVSKKENPPLLSIIKKKQGHLAELRFISSGSDLGKLLTQSDLGVLFIDPTVFSENKILEKIESFRKTAQGINTCLVCLDASPEIPLSLKTSSDIFSLIPKDEKDWERLLSSVLKKTLTRWSRDFLRMELKTFLQKKNLKSAEKIATEIIDLDPLDSEGLKSLGEIAKNQKQAEKALDFFSKAALVNPFSPSIHLKLLEMCSETNFLTIINAAQSFCSGNVDVLFACAKVFLDFEKKESRTKALELIERILKTQPKHEKALELKAKIQN